MLGQLIKSVTKKGIIGFTALFLSSSFLVSNSNADALSKPEIIFNKNIYVNTKVDFKIHNKQQETLKSKHEIKLYKQASNAKLEFLTYSPLGNSQGNILNGSDIARKSSQQFNPLPDAILKNIGLTRGNSVPLVPVSFIKDRQTIFLRITDEIQNKFSDKIETVNVTLNVIRSHSTASLDTSLGLTFSSEITLRLYETGKDTGIFLGYIPFYANSSNSSIINMSDFFIVAAYNTGTADTNFIKVNLDVNTKGRVFNSLTGELLNGLNITLLNATTGKNANILSTDMTKNISATAVTGQNIAGEDIKIDKGEYYFPYVSAGKYRLRVDNLPSSLVFPSTINNNTVATLPLENIVLGEASYGRTFDIETPSSVGFDIPVDSFGKITLSKTSIKQFVGAGEMIPYQLTLKNEEKRSIKNLILKDIPSSDLRYIAGSLKINGTTSNNIIIDPKTLEMVMILPDLAAEGTLEITYNMRSATNNTKEHILRNTAQAFGYGGFISNLATADVMIQDDMLQSYGTIVGRVHFGSCKDGKQIDKDIVGLKDIRLFQEDGTQVTTDKNGRFSFSGITPGMHVVQLDKITLPKGVEMELCHDNTRYAGTNFSQFIDVKGGFVHKANFVVKGDKEKYRLKEAQKSVIIDPATSEKDANFNNLPKQMKMYSEVWLDKQNNDFTLVYPSPQDHPNIKSLNFGVKHPSQYSIEPYLNGLLVSQLHKAAVNANKDDTVRLTHYRGVDLDKGNNELIIYMKDSRSKIQGVIKYNINFNQKIYNAKYLPKASRLQADGLIKPEAVFKLTDNKGGNIAAGGLVKVEISAPYSLETVGQATELEELNQSQNNGGIYTVPITDEGLLKIRLNPTTISGQLKLKIYLDETNYQEETVWLSSIKRDWILVGLAQGTVGYNAVKGNLEQAESQNSIDKDLSKDGKISFYTKGMIDKEWLMTLSYDENRRKDRQKMRFFNSIAPNQKFAVVGDLSQQTSDAPSQYPLYLKLEKKHFYALFGDYDTNLSESTLIPYTRRLSGFQTVYSGDGYSIQGFAAKDSQSFVRDDIRLDGTSGPYKLGGIDIIQGTDRVLIERRLRSNPNTVLETTSLNRYTDYEIDYQEGLINLRPTALPFNFQNELVFLRVEFETYNNGKERTTYGARVTKNFLNDDVIIGMTAIQDAEERGGITGSKGYLTDAKIRLTENTILKMEYGITKGNSIDNITRYNGMPQTNGKSASGQNIEIEHRGDHLYGKAFYQKKENGFGFGTASPFNENTKNYGVEASYDFTEKREDSNHKEITLSEDIKTGLISFFKYNKIQDNNNLGALSITEIGLAKTQGNFKSYVGFRNIQEEANINFGSDEFSFDSNIHQIIAGTEVNILKNKATVFGTTEIPLNSNDNQPSLYGNKQTIGANVNLYKSTTLKVAHRWTDLGIEKTEDTNLTIGTSPFDGMNLSSGTTRYGLPNEELYAFDTQANQQFKLSDSWTANLGIKRHDAVGGKEGVYTQIDQIPDYALPSFLRDNNITSPFSGSSQGYWEDYTSFGVGLIKVEKTWSLSTLSEYRTAETENRYNFSLSWLGDVTDSLAIGFRGAYQWSKFKNGMTTDKFVSDLQDRMRYYGGGINNTSIERLSLLRNSQITSLTGGLAYRPYNEDGPIILQRTEVEQRKNGYDDDFFKIVNNIAIQDNITDNLELNAEYAVKYVKENYNDFSSTEIVHILGNEWRYDLSPKWDIGVSGLIRYAQKSGTKNYSTGLSTGYSPAKNIYLQVGYNVIGFRDDDFTLQSYTAQGLFIKFNMKFDQESVRENLGSFLK